RVLGARLGPKHAVPACVRRKWLTVRPLMPFGGEASKVLVAPGERHRCIRDPPPLDGARAGRTGLVGRRGLSPSPPLAMWDRGRAPTRVDNEGEWRCVPGDPYDAFVERSIDEARMRAIP